MSAVKEIKKKGKIKLFARKLPYSLKKHYGKKTTYKQLEVDRALVDNFVDAQTHRIYAYAMFCDRAEFMRSHKEQSIDFNSLRAEISLICFHRGLEFSVDDIMEYAAGDLSKERDRFETDLAI